MRTLGGLVFGLFIIGFFHHGLPAAQASEVSQETPIQKLRFLLVQYQHLQNGYDPQAIMNSWSGQVLSGNEQAPARESSQYSSPYGSGSREYPASSFVYPQPPSQPPSPSSSVQPGFQFQPPQQPYPPFQQQPNYGPQPYAPYNPHGFSSPAMPGGPGFDPYQPHYQRPMYPAPYQPMNPAMPPQGSCFCA